MGTLSNAFSKKEDPTLKTSFLNKILSSPLIRGFYKDEKPEIDLPVLGSAREQKRLTSLINNIARHSPTGRKILEDAAKDGYSLSFNFSFDCYGSCDPEEKRLELNPLISDSRLTATLAHEARHAQQYTHNIPPFHTLNIASEIMLRRAGEADAQAAAAQTALEIRAATGDESVWNSFSKSSPRLIAPVDVPPASASLHYVEKEQNQIMSSAFERWFYNLRLLNLYEYGYLINPLRNACSADKEQRLEMYKEQTYEHNMTSKQIVDKLCYSADGGNYMSGKEDILYNEDMCAVTKTLKKAANKFFNLRRRDIGEPADKSYVNLPEHYDTCATRFDGGLSSIKEQKSVSAALTVALKNKRQR